MLVIIKLKIAGVCLSQAMVLTVEPGIYIAPDNKNVDKMWRGIGIRIEDNVLVTQKGNEILTEQVPRDRQQIEQLMAG